MQRVILLATIVASASIVSASQWRQCSPMSTKILAVRLPDCDPVHSTEDRCALGTFSNPRVEVDFIQPISAFNSSSTNWIGAYPHNKFDEGGDPCIDSHLVCPGKLNYTQHLKIVTYQQPPSNGLRVTTFRIGLGENMMNLDKPDYLCIDINVLLIMWHPDTPNVQELKRLSASMVDDRQLVERHSADASASFNRVFNQSNGWSVDDSANHKPRLSEKTYDVISREELDQILGAARDDPLPDEFDWREKEGRVGSVKDEGPQCNASWAFAAAGLLEGQELVQNMKSFVSLSEQELIDCVDKNDGCTGYGWPAMVFYSFAAGWIRGVEKNSDYPYEGLLGHCRAQQHRVLPMNKMIGNGYKYLPAKDELALKKTLVNYGPVAVSLQATKRFFAYDGGIFDDDKCTHDVPNHDALVVGYGKDRDEGDYWIIKNCWGTQWGEEGYMRFKAGKNMCGIADFAVIATFS